jgi:hypothetical protein
MSIFKAIGKFFKGAVKVVGKVAGAVLGVNDLFSSNNQKSLPKDFPQNMSPQVSGQTSTSKLSSYILPIGLGAAAFYLITKKK